MVTNNRVSCCSLNPETQLLKEYGLVLPQRGNKPVTGNGLFLSYLSSTVVLLQFSFVRVLREQNY